MSLNSPYQPPHNLDAERSVLGAMFLDGEAVMLATDALRDEDFYQNAHQEIFSAMLALNQRSRAIDIVTLCEELTRRGTLLGVGGVPYVTDLARFVPSAANASSYIKIVEEKSTARRLAKAGRDIHHDSMEGQIETPELLETAEKRIYDIAMRRGGERLTHIRPALYDAYDLIQKTVANKGAITGIPSGFTQLDELTTGFHPGEFIVLGSRPSMGKSTFVMNIAQHAARDAGKKVAVFSLEMPREQLAMRMICSSASINMQHARKGRVANAEWERMAEHLQWLANSGLWIDDSSNLTVANVKSRCRRLQVEDGLDLVIIDYLQLMSTAKASDNRQQEISEISRGIKLLAQELRVPIIAAAQLSRAPQRRTENRPVLSDLRDSGAIEQDADVVMLLYRESYYDKESEAGNNAEVILAKQRNGPLGTVELGFSGEFSRFNNL